jgi:hypothetical protein
VLVYPESGGSEADMLAGVNEPGQVQCPQNPSTLTPCTITINVNTADVGSPSSSSLLEEVGTYAFASARPQAPLSNTQAQADQVPLEVDGVCCFNFQVAAAPVPETPWAALLVAMGTVLIGAGALVRRRRSRAKA